MNKVILIIFIFTAILFLAACNTQHITYLEVEDIYTLSEDIETEIEPAQYIGCAEDTSTLSWQEAYAALLRENHAEERISPDGNLAGFDHFLLHDIDMDGIPELFIRKLIYTGNTRYDYDFIVTVYTFRNGEVVSLEYNEEEIWLRDLFAGAARTNIGPAPRNMPGFVFSIMGPSAGLFGTSSYYWRAVIDGDSLVIADYGEWYIDVKTLYELFDGFGYDTDDDILDAAIQEHTYFSINGNPVSLEELERVFGVFEDEDWWYHQLATVNRNNINDLIFGWVPNESDNNIPAKTVFNNGGSIVQYGDFVYFFVPYGDNYWVRSLVRMDVDSGRQHVLIEQLSPFSRILFAAEGFMFVSAWSESHSSLVLLRIDLVANEHVVLDKGELIYLDTDTLELYYYGRDAYTGSQNGLFKMKIDGRGKTRIAPLGYSFLAKIDGIIYLGGDWNSDSPNVILARVGSDNVLTTVANIPIPARAEDDWVNPNEHIVHFELCGDWIFLSVGGYQGSGNFFYGGLVRLKKDGSNIEWLDFGNIDEFWVIDNYVYFQQFFESPSSWAQSLVRVDPGTLEVEYLGGTIKNLHAYADGSFYHQLLAPKSETAEATASSIYNLYRHDKESASDVRLFSGVDLPTSPDSAYIGYRQVEIVGDYVYFIAYTHGFASGDSWRGHECFYGYYRVRHDGSALEALYKDENLRCPVAHD